MRIFTVVRIPYSNCRIAFEPGYVLNSRVRVCSISWRRRFGSPARPDDIAWTKLVPNDT